MNWKVKKNVKRYGLLLFAKNIGKNVSGKNNQKLLDSTKRSTTDATKTTSTITTQTTGEATGDLIYWKSLL